MYSQDAMFTRRNGSAEPTEEMSAGLACVVCGADYRAATAVEAVVVSHRGDHQLLACRGVCARMTSGAVGGLDEAPLPLAERERRFQAPRT
ncbi:hypothetical protein [Streptomyces sp. SBT349]|uniref:hypothetical protein n=1 Tax=Streptomyces sp. SBT349 TaxID=1580539 RepID=UPI00066AD15F|nr:hypothetical protein [Streptomyces sp. SBT349]